MNSSSVIIMWLWTPHKMPICKQFKCDNLNETRFIAKLRNKCATCRMHIKTQPFKCNPLLNARMFRAQFERGWIYTPFIVHNAVWHASVFMLRCMCMCRRAMIGGIVTVAWKTRPAFTFVVAPFDTMIAHQIYHDNMEHNKMKWTSFRIKTATATTTRRNYSVATLLVHIYKIYMHAFTDTNARCMCIYCVCCRRMMNIMYFVKRNKVIPNVK